MNDSTEIAVIGEKDIILPFRAIGFAVYYDTDPDAIIKRCRELTESNCKIILLPEKEAEKVGDYINSRAGYAYPIIMPIPDGITNSGYGIKRLEKNIEKAMGQKTGENI
jgi:V/A-type H+-transporting ATPase subunit F